MLGIGEKARIVGFNGQAEIKKHLAEIGFILGKNIEVIQKTFGSGLIVAIEGVRIVLDRKMARRVNISLAKEVVNAN